MKNYILWILLLVSFLGQSQEHACVYFTDKPNVQTAINNPSSILSQRAITRKNLHNIPIDARDVPVNENYIATIKNQTGIVVKAKSKWFNCVHVLGSIQNINNLNSLGFVQNIVFANDMLNPRPSQTKQNQEVQQKFEVNANYNYGASNNQVTMLHVEDLHEDDYIGTGMLIAVLDSGFPNVLNNPGFAALKQENLL